MIYEEDDPIFEYYRIMDYKFGESKMMKRCILLRHNTASMILLVEISERLAC